MKQIERNSSIELLRIFAIFIIIIDHYALYCGFNFNGGIKETIIPYWLHIGGKLGVNIFIFISGYFLCTSKKLKIEKLIKIILEVFLYSILILLVGIKINNVSLFSAIRLIFAIPTGYWQFITLYIMLYILSPYINIFLYKVKIKELLSLIIILTLTWVIFPTFAYYGFDIQYSIAWYIYIYILAAFFRRIEKKIPKKPKRYITLGFGFICIIALSEIIIKYIGISYISKLERGIEHFRNYNSLFVISATISLFLGFKQLNIKNNRVINKIASTSLAVFVLHANEVYKILLFQNVINGAKFQYSKLLIPHAIGTCLVIFIVFAIIDLLRQKFIEKPVMKYLTPKIERIDDKINNEIEKLANKLT